MPDANPVVVLSHDFWERRFGADPAILGRSLVLNGTPFTVVGVAARGFRGPFALAPDIWVPLAATTHLGMPAGMFTLRAGSWLMAIGRLAPSAGLGQARAELATIAARLAQDYPDAYDGQGVAVERATLFPGDIGSAIGGFLGLLLRSPDWC